MKEYARGAHIQAGLGAYPVDWLLLKNQIIEFENPKYREKQVDVLEYTVYVEKPGVTTGSTRYWKYRYDHERWQITPGLRADCVYYLSIKNASAPIRSYNLRQQVCGIFEYCDVKM